MEGYTNIAGSQYDFDDLDIEGKVVDEWNTDVADKEKKLNEITKLNEHVKLDNGQQADVFSVFKKNEHVWYTCHVCCDTMVGLSSIRQHVETKKHRTNMSKPVHPRAQFVKLDPKENLALEPGEPVPPGLEEVIIKNCLIQPKLDAWNKSPLIGLEFLVELTQYALDEGVYYYCLLCDKTGSERNILIHFTSIFHYMKYLSVYFPTAARKLQALPNRKIKKSFGLLVTEIVADIEAKYGRMKPQSETHTNFYAPGRKMELQTLVNDGPHIREREGETFAEKATAENVDKNTKELQCIPPKNEDIEMPGENKEFMGSIFNKNNRISVDKKQLRSREEDNRNSPDLQIINIQLPKSPEKKKVARSRSLSSASTISSSSSQSRGRNHYHGRSRHHLKVSSNVKSHRNWSRSRSRSRSPSYRHRRHRSPSYSRKLSPGSRHRDRSPYRKWNRRRDSHGRSPDPYKYRGTDRYGRSREQYDSRGDKYRRTEDKDASKELGNTEEKIRWEKFREDLKKIEYVKLEKLKYHEKNPEKHPQYPEEWKSFWNRRYNELQRSGVDPSKHDFKPEWISFWTKRMKELYEEDLSKAKDELKKKFDLPEDPSDTSQNERGTQWKHHLRKRSNTSPGLIDISPPTPDKKDVIADIKTTWKAFTGSDIKDTPKRPLSPWEEDNKAQDINLHTKRDFRRQSPKSRSQSPPISANDKLLEDMPQRKSRTSSLIFVLRKLTVLEQQLGSLAPKVFEILTQSLALEKIKEDASLDLLLEEENSMFLETVREKLIALLCAGVVPRNIVNTARSAIKHIDISLYLSTKRQRAIPIETVKPIMGLPISSRNVSQYAQQPKSEPVVVPGVGQVDKVAIAQQIAAALVEQGKTNVTEVELEQLINAVVGMAEASIHSTQPMTTANFLHQLQSMQNAAMPIISSTSLPSTDMTVSMFTSTSQPSTKTETVVITNPQSQVAFGALKMLQSAYNDTVKLEQDSPKPEITQTDSSPVSDKELATTLAYFNKSSEENQISFINGLQATNPEMYKKIHPFIPSNILNLSSRPKRSPITISILKAKSEPKIKPLDSGRLSPFSSRQGGANPTGEDRVVIDDDDEEDKSDVKVVNENLSKPHLSQGNTGKSQEYTKFNIIGGGDSENIDDDDDDDYSFEDVYKAAQEKLKQKQLDEDKNRIQSVGRKELNANDNIIETNIEESQSINSEITNNETWTVTSGVKNMLSVNESSKKNQPQQSNSKSQFQHALQRSLHEASPLDGVEFSDTSFHQGQHNPYQAAEVSWTLSNQEMIQRKQQLAKSFCESTQPFYSKTNTEVYNKNHQYIRDSSFSFDNPPRDPYAIPNRGPYNRDCYNVPYSSEVHSGYEDQMNSYEDQYRYRDTCFGGEYSDAREPSRPSYSGLSTYPSSTSRYDSSYPPY